MTHTKDYTLLSRLGFNDPDKRNQEHDLAIAYLRQDEVAARVAQLVLKSSPIDTGSEYKLFCATCGQDTWQAHQRIRNSWRVACTASELPISKGEGRYKTTIGWGDLYIGCDELGEVWLTCTSCGSRTRTHKKSRLSIRGVLVEVKIGRVGVGDILRQLKLYSGTLDGTVSIGIERYDRLHLVAATRYPLTKVEAETLRNEGIYPIRLGEGFDKFLASHRDETVEEVDTL